MKGHRLLLIDGSWAVLSKRQGARLWVRKPGQPGSLRAISFAMVRGYEVEVSPHLIPRKRWLYLTGRVR